MNFSNDRAVGARYHKLQRIIDGVLLCAFLSTCTTNLRASPYADYQTKTDLRIPLTGVNYITNGGRALSKNPHNKSRSQRFGIDIISLPAETAENAQATRVIFKRFYKGSRLKNDSHYCFGRLVVAPGDGVIFSVNSHVDDNKKLGTRNNDVIPGNHIVIDHENGEYSMLAHFKKDTIRVNRHDRVQQGDPLGECGNSGRSTQPHVHYHLQTSPLWFHGDGLPIQFRNFYADGKLIERGEVSRGAIVAHPDSESN